MQRGRSYSAGLLDSSVKWGWHVLQPWQKCGCGVYDITLWYVHFTKILHSKYLKANTQTDLLLACLNVLNSAALNVAPVTSNSFVLHFSLNHDHVNMTFGVEVDGQQWALTRRNFYIVFYIYCERFSEQGACDKTTADCLYGTIQ